MKERGKLARVVLDADNRKSGAGQGSNVDQFYSSVRNLWRASHRDCAGHSGYACGRCGGDILGDGKRVKRNCCSETREPHFDLEVIDNA